MITSLQRGDWTIDLCIGHSSDMTSIVIDEDVNSSVIRWQILFTEKIDTKNWSRER